MNPIATSTRSRLGVGVVRGRDGDPADDIAPKKMRANVCSISASTFQSPAPSTARTMSST